MKNINYSMFDNRYDNPMDALDNESDRYLDYPITEDNGTESAEEFSIDDSYGVDIADPESEQAATLDFDGDFGSSDNGMNNRETNLDALYVENSDEADTEFSEEFDEENVAEPKKDGAVCLCDSSDPYAEMAASSDDNCYCDSRSICGGTIRAQEKCALDDYEIISDVLGSEKQLVKLYSTALCESAEEPLRNVIRDNLMECANDQYATFEYMQKHGMYKTEQAEEEKILQAKQQFCPICHKD